MWSLLEFFPEDFQINILDVGAALAEKPPYQSLVDVGRGRIFGFEPDQQECERLNREYGNPHRFFPFFVGDGRPAIFHETNWALTGSLYEPNSRLLEKFQNLAEVVTPVATHRVNTTRLDDITEIGDIDFIKIDVQGSELSVLKNASRQLSSALLVQTEVEFVELYRGQPMFADVDVFLRAKGFQFHAFNGIGSRAFKPLLVNGNVNSGLRQALWSDALYVRDWMDLEVLSETKLRNYAILAHDVVHSYDLAHLVLSALDNKTGGGLAARYLNRLVETEPRVSRGGPKMLGATVLTQVDGVQVVVPDSLDLITPYVLREQLDFFEDELRFVRRLLQPGQKVIDIGANYGVYTLSMAKKVGTTGHVWAFEPTSTTAGFLKQGIVANGFGQVTVEQTAVSSASGTAQLSLQREPELNSIVHGESSAAASETVPLVTLDECMDRYQWTDIELVKIDAEGEECNIVKGGRRFFADLAPLVQYELRKGVEDLNYQLIRDFADLAYRSYRLVPGLNVLVPVQVDSPLDPYLLNLFCCKAGRADALAARGLLLRPSDLAGAGVALEAHAGHHWRRALSHLPYAAPFASAWGEAEATGNSAEVIRALSSYARSRDHALSQADRFRALEASYSTLKELCAREPTRLRLASLARAAHDLGERAQSVNALTRLLANIRQSGVDPSEPFLAPLERFDSIAPEPEPARWLVAAVLEQLEHRERFSSFYAGPNALERLEDIHALGLGSAEMTRRLNLVRLRITARAARGTPEAVSAVGGLRHSRLRHY